MNEPIQNFHGHFENNGSPKAGHEDDFIIVTQADLDRWLEKHDARPA